MANIIDETYEIIGEIGHGGGGDVYLANHRRLKKRVVLKLDRRKSSVRTELLRREVDVLKELNHPNIPQVYDYITGKDLVDASNGQPPPEVICTVMEYIEGESLDVPLGRGEMFSQPQVIDWAIQLLDALSYLHRPIHGDPPRGFVHSDIKPANLMLRPDRTICLIDFNIALALGEESVIGCSAGYSSPEHYGLDYSSLGVSRDTLRETEELEPETDTLPEELPTVTLGRTSPLRDPHKHGNVSTGSGRRTRLVVPDVRSDIYSVGATLYHLLSGKRPAQNAMAVEPLSRERFSPPLVDIVTRAMNPNPDLRYQSAEEMRTALERLWQDDPRMQKLRRKRRLACGLCAAGLAVGLILTFAGLSRMRLTERWLRLAEYSSQALLQGDVDAAIQYALEALPTGGLLEPEPVPQAQAALADGLGVYDLSNGYKNHMTLELDAEPLCLALSPAGRTGACLAGGEVLIFDTDSGERLAALPAQGSALSEMVFRGEGLLLYAGTDGLTAYSLDTGSVLWTGDQATGVALAAGGSRVAAVYRDESTASVYDVDTGERVCQVDFEGRRQSVVTNDSFANPHDSLLALSPSGDWLAASFSDGSVWLYDLTGAGKTVCLLDDSGEYTHVEGGFSGQYFAFAAVGGSNGSVFAVVDTETMEQTGGFQSSESVFHVQTDEKGIYLHSDHILVAIDPVTGEQRALVDTAEHLDAFATDGTHTLVTAPEEYLFFDGRADLLSSYSRISQSSLLALSGDTALIASLDVSAVRIMTYEDHPEQELLSYDPEDTHSEARLSADGERVMLFSYRRFTIYALDGQLVCEVELPDPENIYDQQYRREGERSWLEVTYYDGTVLSYDGGDGTLVGEETIPPPDRSLHESFESDSLRFEAPLHGVTEVYDRQSGQLVTQLTEDAYLTYVTQVEEGIVLQFITADGYYYGLLVDEQCRTLARLPYLSDVVEERLIFDYPSGHIRQSDIYPLEALIKQAQAVQTETTGGMS